jgi:hypothetical protein
VPAPVGWLSVSSGPAGMMNGSGLDMDMDLNIEK